MSFAVIKRKVEIFFFLGQRAKHKIWKAKLIKLSFSAIDVLKNSLDSFNSQNLKDTMFQNDLA